MLVLALLFAPALADAGNPREPEFTQPAAGPMPPSQGQQLLLASGAGCAWPTATTKGQGYSAP